MKTQTIIQAALLMALAGGSIAIAGPVPAATFKGNVNGIDVSISAAGAQTNGAKSIGVITTGVAGGFDAANTFGLAITTVSCNPQSDNGAPSPRYPTGPLLVAGSQLEMGDWIQMWEVANGRNNVSLGTSAGDRHPYIATQIYRTNADGRLEMLATSWAKHSFSAASASQGAVGGANGQPACGTGSCATFAGDNELEANCSDTYGAGLNSSPSYLGPRHEISARGGMNTPGWHYQNSWFDNYTTTGTGTALLETLAPVLSRNDGNRSLNAGTISNYKLAIVRRDEVNAAALGPNGRVFMEGYYVVNGDNYKLNNIANRRYTSTVTTAAAPSTASFNFDGPHTWGPTILQWGDLKSQADPSTDGQVIVASRVVDLGGGSYRYEYNVFNLDLDRGIDRIEIPVPGVVGVSGHGFFQPRQYWPTYDNAAWTSSYDSGTQRVVFSAPAAPVLTDPQLAALVPPMPAGTVIKKNAVRWGTMYTFWFTANVGPRTADQLMQLNPMTAGSFSGMMTSEIKAPRHPADMGIQGGTAGDDGSLDNNDFVSFVDLFFALDPRADVGIQGGTFGHDGQFDNNDFVAFIDLFFNP